MALEGGMAVLEKSLTHGTAEADMLPECMGTRCESDCLPDRLGTGPESECLPDMLESRQETELPAQGAEVQSEDLAKLDAMLNTPEGIEKLMASHPEKAELWRSALEAVEILNDPDATDAERRSANGKLSAMQGQLLELSVKDLMAERGLSVESKQRTVEGEDGGTRPDVIAKNETSAPVSIFEITVMPGETLSVECKCGGKTYLSSQLRDHIPNQLSGQIGHKMLLTTGDIQQVDRSLIQNTCGKYNAKLLVLGITASDVRNAIKGVSVS